MGRECRNGQHASIKKGEHYVHLNMRIDQGMTVIDESWFIQHALILQMQILSLDILFLSPTLAPSSTSFHHRQFERAMRRIFLDDQKELWS